MANVYAALFFLALTTVILALYLLTLQRAMSRCSPRNRTMSPGLVWLQLIPVFGLYWHFKNVTELSRSLANEYHARGATVDEPHLALGYAMGLCLIIGYGIMFISEAAGRGSSGLATQDVSNLRLLGSLVALAGLVTTILYWMRVSRTSRRVVTLAPPMRAGAASAFAFPASSSLAVCARCGQAVPAGRFCPRCGAERASVEASEQWRAS